MPPAIRVATIEGAGQEHVDRADKNGVAVGCQSPITISPTNAALHDVEVDLCIQSETRKPLAEAVGGLLDKGAHR